MPRNTIAGSYSKTIFSFLRNHQYCFTFRLAMNGYLTIILICSYLMINNVEHLLHAYLISLGLFWWDVCLDFLPIFNLAFVFLLLSIKCYLYTLDTSPLSDMCFADIFFADMTDLFTFLTVSYTEVFNCNKSKISVFFPFLKRFYF